MKTKFSSYKLPEDHLEQAAKAVADCSVAIVVKKDEIKELEAQKEEEERKLLALLRQKKRKYVIVDKVKYYISSDGALGKELVL